MIGYETIIFQGDTVSRPWVKLFNYINIKHFSYHKKTGQHSPTPAVWLFLLSRLDERTVPVSFSVLEMSFLGTKQEELAVLPFFYRPCNVQSTVQGMRSMFITYTFCDLHSHSMFAVSGGTRKRVRLSKTWGRYFQVSKWKLLSDWPGWVGDFLLGKYRFKLTGPIGKGPDRSSCN